MNDNTDKNIESGLKVAYHTLGCKLNFAETSTLGKLLSARGIRESHEGEEPDLIVVNTCSVTEHADKKDRQLIRKLAKEHPEASIVVTGCYAQLKPKEAATLPGVEIVLGSNEKLLAADYIERWVAEHTTIMEVTDSLKIREFRPSCQRGDRTRYFLKVQDGCDYFCTYCTIPYARGRSRSGNISDLTALAREAAAEGGKEIVITGVNIGDFGRDTGESFFDLLRALDEVEGIERYRISSIEPNLLTAEIIRWVATESRAFMPHFHIPLQAGCDEVLRLMNRRYDTSLFRSRIETVREWLPDAFIGVDIIAGARGETPELWKRSVEFVESLPVSRLHVFPYSERPGTKALNIDYIVSQEEKHRRVGVLTDISDRKLQNFMATMQGRRSKVLWEHPSGRGQMQGFTENYLRVTADLDRGKINTVSEVTLAEVSESNPELFIGKE